MKIINNKLYIQKRLPFEWMTLFIFVSPFLMAFFVEFLNLLGLVKYSVDLICISAALILYAHKKSMVKSEIMPFAVFIAIFFCYLLVVYLFNFQSPFYFLWGVRNNFRFYIAFILFSVAFDEEDVYGCLNFMDVLFWVNVVISFFQFFVMGYRQDYLGGIFGVEKGCNAFSIIFFSIIIGKSLLLFMNNQQSIWNCFIKCGFSLVIAAMAELKFYFVLFAMILFVSAVMTRFSFRKLMMIFGAALILMLSSLLLPVIFGESRTLNLENLIETITASNYATAKDLGRFTAIPTIARNYLTDWSGRLFGLGLGNCDTSTFEICNSEFYKTHAFLNYNWFSSAFLFLETGFIGLFTYLSFFVLCFFSARRRLKKGESDELLCRISMIMSIVCFIMIFYNASLRTEVGYMAFFSLALPFAGKTKNKISITNSDGV